MKRGRRGGKVQGAALSLGERVARVASQVRGYVVVPDYAVFFCGGSDPSPVPHRLVKTPAAVHPLPSGEGEDSAYFSSGKRQR
jgi:hypothetical protein